MAGRSTVAQSLVARGRDRNAEGASGISMTGDTDHLKHGNISLTRAAHKSVHLVIAQYTEIRWIPID
jgi:hypothetical protein